jgi:hypothetical protein
MFIWVYDENNGKGCSFKSKFVGTSKFFGKKFFPEIFLSMPAGSPLCA